MVLVYISCHPLIHQNNGHQICLDKDLNNFYDVFEFRYHKLLSKFPNVTTYSILHEL
jgi:hypothetical protein